MSRNLRGRLDRLEKSVPQSAKKSSDGLLLRVMRASVGNGELDSADAQEFRTLLENTQAERARAVEASPAGKIFRRELDRLGLPQPKTLKDLDVWAECLRLTRSPTPELLSTSPNPS
jgi:hypothetical protein